MSDAIPGTSARPRVTPDERSMPFFDGCKRGVLMLPKCVTCGSWGALADFACTICGGNSLAWEASSGTGHVHTFGLVHQAAHPGFRGEIPYNVVVVELSEGVRLNSRIVGCSNADIRVAMSVVVDFLEVGDGLAVPVFRPRS